MKRTTIMLEDAVYKAAKVKAVMSDKTFAKYVAELIEKDVYQLWQNEKE